MYTADVALNMIFDISQEHCHVIYFMYLPFKKGKTFSKLKQEALKSRFKKRGGRGGGAAREVYKGCRRY